MGKGLDTGKSFWQGVLGKITDPEQKAAAEKLLGNATLMTELGNGVEGQSEIDRQLQKLRTQEEELTARVTELDQREEGLRTWHTDLSAWREANKAAIERGMKARSADGNGDGKPGMKPGETPPPAGLTEEQFKEHMVGERAAFLGFERDRQRLTREHFERFKEIVDIDPLLQHPKITEVGLLGVYELVHKDRLDKFKTDAQKAHDDSVAAEAVRKHQEAQAQMPYPPPTGAGSGSPLDALTTGAKDSVVDAATQHYNRLQAERVGAATH